ncbi:MAG: hypothetical protein A2487_18705 [Candidatus Raymondbacteria bacterium RifOxyC12_full_50_8]|uniref:Uncharacterized protein n=1 Tax=Candidatus Raymondbacteria bacterium RIFOXYD12_FULL_49_13 TaxID=1817890 RepID=A0A1F7FM88_UNCRA|nr:MAG: hypothetical protein A2248_15855 [Candidatus Raymondbacteria bacterium RIFOXYA2_FULL_49_16]OGJ96091.1 MAG: hypothetical protein A2453_08395 [Candidatus Raymondbacteria bacterium RIFOXYC2_FULL_50_21]OGJ99582.1 MAG: hypothetical protein A2350_06065 [Candidatus Raymondbacteria bacterium RifOxyB12_full_50_8]OGK03447.1 MAG: hypothetical protein A2487_18705 [Candidatus Raymondbacteria bacterium RifOxyC12_full_50_8]OGK07616.1 MAG: hypothetical protein A2519_21870 [Candidatus Raymondbacteria ba
MELESIRQRHQEGLSGEIKNQLVACLQKNIDEFAAFFKDEKKAWQKEIDVFTALKLYFLQKKTINVREEMNSQIEEMSKEIERRTKADPRADSNQIKLEWTKQNAAHWRAHRILEIIYVLNENRNLFMNMVAHIA